MNSLCQIIVILSILHITLSYTPSSILIETSGNEAIYNRHARPFLATWRQNTKRVTIGKAMKILDWAFGDRVSTILINEKKIFRGIFNYSLASYLFCKISIQVFGFEKNGKIKLMNIDPKSVNIQNLVSRAIGMAPRHVKRETPQENRNMKIKITKQTNKTLEENASSEKIRCILQPKTCI